MNDEFDYYVDPPEMTEDDKIVQELSYSFTSMEVQREIMAAWASLKDKMLIKCPSLKDDIDSFDKLLNYYY